MQLAFTMLKRLVLLQRLTWLQKEHMIVLARFQKQATKMRCVVHRAIGVIGAEEVATDAEAKDVFEMARIAKQPEEDGLHVVEEA